MMRSCVRTTSLEEANALAWSNVSATFPVATRGILLCFGGLLGGAVVQNLAILSFNWWNSSPVLANLVSFQRCSWPHTHNILHVNTVVGWSYTGSWWYHSYWSDHQDTDQHMASSLVLWHPVMNTETLWLQRTSLQCSHPRAPCHLYWSYATFHTTCDLSFNL